MKQINKNFSVATLSSILTTIILVFAAPVVAEEDPGAAEQMVDAVGNVVEGTAKAVGKVVEGVFGGVQALMEEVLVTARKKSNTEAVQDVPVTVTAYSGDQLEALFVRDLQSLSFSMPNVSLEDIGTISGTANFSMRGLGVNSSIPSIDPTVGVFVDGMYLGINAGVIFDNFDLEGIEALRGPQGLLFGRNVTGGAVLLKTRKPTDEFTANFKVGLEEGLEKLVAGSVSGPLLEDKLSGRITAYYKDDDGFHTNLANGNNDFGKEETILVRPSSFFTPNDSMDLIVRYEHGEIKGDGPASQNRGLFDRNSYDFAIDEEGSIDVEWDQVIAEINFDVAFGNGTITNIFAWRDYKSDSVSDIDATTTALFHVLAKIRQDQISNEFRYNGTFLDERLSLTTGFFWFEQDIGYFENRLLFQAPTVAPNPLLPPFAFIDSTLGGQQDQTTLGIFLSTDIDITFNLTLNLGGRYTYEKKSVDVATFTNAIFLAPGVPLVFPGVSFPSACDFDAETCNFDFTDRHSWNNFTPKVGLQWRPSEDTQFYGFWTKGFRSGGYNFRNTSPDPLATLGPFDEEEQTSFEMGAKIDWLDGRVRTNMAVFINDMENLQREINLPGAVAGVVQIIRNTADASIKGVEFETQILVLDNLLVTGSVGYVDGDYKNIIFDLTGDGVIDSADLALDIPRLAKVSYSIGLIHDLNVGSIGSLTSRLSFSHRDSAAYTDNNLGTLNEADMLDISMALTTFDDKVEIAVYGKNLLNEITAGNDTQLPFFPGATFSPINNKGSRWGVEINYRY